MKMIKLLLLTNFFLCISSLTIDEKLKNNAVIEDDKLTYMLIDHFNHTITHRNDLHCSFIENNIVIYGEYLKEYTWRNHRYLVYFKHPPTAPSIYLPIYQLYKYDDNKWSLIGDQNLDPIGRRDIGNLGILIIRKLEKMILDNDPGLTKTMIPFQSVERYYKNNKNIMIIIKSKTFDQFFFDTIFNMYKPRLGIY